MSDKYKTALFELLNIPTLKYMKYLPQKKLKIKSVNYYKDIFVLVGIFPVTRTMDVIRTKYRQQTYLKLGSLYMRKNVYKWDFSYGILNA